MFTLRLSRFWPGAEIEGGFFSQLVAAAIGEPVRVVTQTREQADLEIVQGGVSLPSVLLARVAARLDPREARDGRWADQGIVRPTQARSIWFTAENLRPPASSDWSGFLSFDTDPIEGRNAYLPLWMLDLKDFNATGDLAIDELMATREPEVDRSGFVCAFIGNPDPMRFHAINALERLGPVDVFGKSVGKPVPSKSAVARGYRYILSFENDLYPGYVTEKVLDGARTGCVPLYRGIDYRGDFNPNGLVNVTPELGLARLTDMVASLESDAELRAHILSEWVLQQRPTLDASVELIRRVLDD